MKKALLSLLASAVALASGSAFALAPTTIAELTTGISFTDVTLGILAVAGIMIAVYVGKRAATFVVQAVKSM